MNKFISTVCLSIALVVTPVLAQASIELVTKAEVEVKITGKDGKQKIKRMPAAKVVPGTAVIYTITARNTGKQPAQNVTINDPIPEHMVYVDGSAKGKSADISFSVDGGKTYASPDQLTVRGKDGKSRKATAKDYTHIRWILKNELQPNQSAPVWFKARLK